MREAHIYIRPVNPWMSKTVLFYSLIPKVVLILLTEIVFKNKTRINASSVQFLHEEMFRMDHGRKSAIDTYCSGGMMYSFTPRWTIGIT